MIVTPFCSHSWRSGCDMLHPLTLMQASFLQCWSRWKVTSVIFSHHITFTSWRLELSWTHWNDASIWNKHPLLFLKWAYLLFYNKMSMRVEWWGNIVAPSQLPYLWCLSCYQPSTQINEVYLEIRQMMKRLSLHIRWERLQRVWSPTPTEFPMFKWVSKQVCWTNSARIASFTFVCLRGENGYGILC